MTTYWMTHYYNSQGSGAMICPGWWSREQVSDSTDSLIEAMSRYGIKVYSYTIGQEDLTDEEASFYEDNEW